MVSRIPTDVQTFFKASGAMVMASGMTGAGGGGTTKEVDTVRDEEGCGTSRAMDTSGASATSTLLAGATDGSTDGPGTGIAACYRTEG